MNQPRFDYPAKFSLSREPFFAADTLSLVEGGKIAEIIQLLRAASSRSPRAP